MGYFLCNINYATCFADSFLRGGSKANVGLVLSELCVYRHEHFHMNSIYISEFHQSWISAVFKSVVFDLNNTGHEETHSEVVC